MNKPETRWADADGVRIAYQAYGDGPRTLVGIPGFAQHLDLVWDQPAARRFFERLGEICRVIHFDKRGTGLSDRAVPPASLDTRMRDVTAVMDAEGVDRAVIGGWSEGATLAAFFAATYPERADGLILSGGYASFVRTPDHPWVWNARTQLLGLRLFARLWGQGVVGAAMFAPSMAKSPAFWRWMRHYERAAIDRRQVLAVSNLNAELDIRPILAAIRTPTIVLHARGDRLVPWRSGRYLADHINGARFELLDVKDHAIWFAAQDAYLDAITGFLDWQPDHTPERGRVLATVLFTDIVASTEHANRVGDSQWIDVLQRHDEISRQEIARMRGRWVKSTGDGMLATFDGPAGAIKCAEAVRHRIQDELGLQITAGLHTGEVELRPADVGGMAVHIASRVQALAQPMEIMASATLKHLTAGTGITYESRGHHQLKGIPGTCELYRVR